MSEVVLEQAKGLVTKLSPSEKAHLIEWLEATLGDGTAMPATPRRSLYGL